MFKKLKKKIFSSSIFRYFYFKYLSNKFGLNLDFESNKEALHILREVFVKGVYSKYFPIKGKATVVDIGAHFGYFSMYAYKSSTTDTQIYAFEPSSKNFNILKNNIINAHAQHVTPVNKAVTATDEIVKLSLFNHQNNSIFSDYISTENVDNEEVQGISLTSIFSNFNINKIDFLKMDCEGAEYEILLNTPKHILDKISIINMELHDMSTQGYDAKMLLSHLAAAGFKPECTTADVGSVNAIYYFTK